MKCILGNNMHGRFKSFGRCFIEFWHNYFQSSGVCVRDLPIKHFLSAVDLVNLCDLSTCCCKNLPQKLFPDKKKYWCSHCQKSLPTESALKVHEAKHKLEKPRFECVFCMKNSGTKVALLRHMELHTKEYECKICQQPLHWKDFERHKTTNKHLKRVAFLKEQKPHRSKDK